MDDLAAAYVLAVENFEKAAHLVFSYQGTRGVPMDTPSIADTSLTAATGPPFLLLFPSPFLYLQLYPLYICGIFLKAVIPL